MAGSNEVNVNEAKPLSTTEIVPVIIFFHGGSFAHSSANSAIYDTFCRRLVGICKAVVVSVNYRRSPEHRYPCAYDDGWAALKWVHSRSWLQSGKDSKAHVYLAGDSSGGNIAHHVAVRAAESGVEVLGNIVLHPFFGGQERKESETRLDGKYFMTLRDRDWYWRAYLPEGEDRDHPACNIFGPRSKSIQGLHNFPKSLVCVAGLDLVQDWQLAYVEGLKEARHEVQLLFLKEATIEADDCLVGHGALNRCNPKAKTEHSNKQHLKRNDWGKVQIIDLTIFQYLFPLISLSSLDYLLLDGLVLEFVIIANHKNWRCFDGGNSSTSG
uniref:Gibberellin binding protein n=1 Tax=Panax ginseng TaxID=4054 RepID=A0A3S8TLI1_PANGI|nr:gibberellin binding protein [Panax ginseng]